jgi:hypothetical protein
MSFKNFTEYLDQKGNLQSKAITDPLGDTAPKAPPRPPKPVTKGKGWKDYKATEAAEVQDGEEGAPYKGSGTDPGQQKYEKGLVYQGDKKLVYEPNTADQTLKAGLNGTKTEQFIEKTKNMKADEYANFILKGHDSSALKKILETVEILSKNANLSETFIREIKRKGGFSTLMESVLRQPETYKEFAAALANATNGPEVGRQLAKAIAEITPESVTEESKKMLRPEHNLINALAANKNIRNSLQEVFGAKYITASSAIDELNQLAHSGHLDQGSLSSVAQKYNMDVQHLKDFVVKNHPELANNLI